MRSCFEDVYLFRSQDPTFLVLRVCLHLRYQYVYTHTHTHTHTLTPSQDVQKAQYFGRYGVATISRLLKITGLFCKRTL